MLEFDRLTIIVSVLLIDIVIIGCIIVSIIELFKISRQLINNWKMKKATIKTEMKIIEVKSKGGTIMNLYSFEYNNGLKYTTIASTEKEAFTNFYESQGIDKFDNNIIFNFTNIKVTKLNECGQLPHSQCFDCQNCPGSII